MPAKNDKSLALLIGGPSPKPEAAGGEDYNADLEVQADELMGAIAAKDAGGVAAAFKAMHELCARGGG